MLNVASSKPAWFASNQATLRSLSLPRWVYVGVRAYWPGISIKIIFVKHNPSTFVRLVLMNKLCGLYFNQNKNFGEGSKQGQWVKPVVCTGESNPSTCFVDAET